MSNALTIKFNIVSTDGVFHGSCTVAISENVNPFEIARYIYWYSLLDKTNLIDTYEDKGRFYFNFIKENESKLTVNFMYPSHVCGDPNCFATVLAKYIEDYGRAYSTSKLRKINISEGSTIGYFMFLEVYLVDEDTNESQKMNQLPLFPIDFDRMEREDDCDVYPLSTNEIKYTNESGILEHHFTGRLGINVVGTETVRDEFGRTIFKIFIRNNGDIHENYYYILKISSEIANMINNDSFRRYGALVSRQIWNGKIKMLNLKNLTED